MTAPQHLEIVFPANIFPGDLAILTPASHAGPGLARLDAARVELLNGCGARVYTANGGALIGVVCYGEPEAPFEETYLLNEEDLNNGLR